MSPLPLRFILNPSKEAGFVKEIFIIFNHVYMREYKFARSCMWRSEDNLQESPSTVWVPRIEAGLLALLASAFIQ